MAKETWEKELSQKINSVISYAVNGECGGVTVEYEKKRLIKFVNQTIKEEIKKSKDKIIKEIIEEIELKKSFAEIDFHYCNCDNNGCRGCIFKTIPIIYSDLIKKISK